MQTNLNGHQSKAASRVVQGGLYHAMPEACLCNRSRDIRRKAHLHLLEGYVARAYMVEPGDLYLRTRGPADVAEARQLVMYVAHVEIGLTMAEVATRYRRDRSTAAHACREVEDRREDPVFDALVTHIEALVTLRQEPFLQPDQRERPHNAFEDRENCDPMSSRGAGQ